MKIIHLEEKNLDLESAISLAREEPILLLTAGGQEFLLSLADDFDKEVESLRRSQAFQRFLDERSASPPRIPLEDVESKIDRELAGKEE
jgi:hypothetical protein